MLSKKIPCALVAAALAFAGCSISPTNLKPPAREANVHLAKGFVYEASAKMGGARVEQALLPGVYRAVAEDEAGTYHQGPSLCYSVKVLDPGWALRAETRGQVLRHQDCGIYVPHDAAAPVRIYVVLGSESTKGPDPTPSAEVALRNATIPPTASPSAQMRGGVGVGLGVATASALADAEKGNLDFIVYQPEGNALRKALTDHP